jgi:hypothetical protein
MNTQEQLRQAMAELHDGSFIRHGLAAAGGHASRQSRR